MLWGIVLDMKQALQHNSLIFLNALCPKSGSQTQKNLNKLLKNMLVALVQYKGWKQKGSKCHWRKQQMEPFLIHHSN